MKERELKLAQAKALREYATKLETQVKIQDELDMAYDMDMVAKLIEEDIWELINCCDDLSEIRGMDKYTEKYNISWSLKNPIKVQFELFEKKDGDK